MSKIHRGNAFLLQWVKDNPQTDKACAMAIYWMNGPGWLKRFDSREHCEKEDGWAALLKPIEGEVVKIDYYKYTEGLPHAFWDKVEAIFEKYEVLEEDW